MVSHLRSVGRVDIDWKDEVGGRGEACSSVVYVDIILVTIKWPYIAPANCLARRMPTGQPHHGDLPS